MGWFKLTIRNLVFKKLIKKAARVSVTSALTLAAFSIEVLYASADEKFKNI